MTMSKGSLIVLSGPSGSGKGTILAQLLAEREDTVPSVSVTTRKPRPFEVDGVHYFFRAKEEFEKMIKENELLEYAEYNGNYYGTPADHVRKQLDAGKNVVLEIEVQGAEKVMDYRSDVISIFITTPSMKELERRLRGRGTESEEVIQNRLKTARWELSRAFRYQYVVLNDEIPDAVRRIHTILDAESLRYHRMEQYILEES